MSYEDWLDAPSTSRPTAGFKNNKIFTSKFYEMGLTSPKPVSDGIVTIRLRGVPDNSGGIRPFLYARGSRDVFAEVGDLYGFTCAFMLNVVEFFGPRPPESDDGDRVGYQLSWIDDYPPAERIKAANEGRKLPPTFAQLISIKAPLVSKAQQRFNAFWNSDEFKSPVRQGKPVLFVPAMLVDHPLEEASVEAPVACVIRLSKSAASSLKEFVLQEKEGYRLPDNPTHEQLSTREELARRFVVPDLVNPAGAPLVSFSYVKQKRGQKSNFTGNHYKCTYAYQPGNPQPLVLALPAEIQKQWWLHPDEMFNFLTVEEQRDFALEMSWNNDWADFLCECLRGTPLEVSIGTRGVDLQHQQQQQEQRLMAAIVGQTMGMSTAGVQALAGQEQNAGGQPPTPQQAQDFISQQQPQVMGAPQQQVPVMGVPQQPQALGASQPPAPGLPGQMQAQPVSGFEIGQPEQPKQDVVNHLPDPSAVFGQQQQQQQETQPIPNNADLQAKQAAAEQALRNLMQ